DAARARARAADGATAAGAGPLPPMHGVPIAIKDLTLTKGVRTTFGSRVFATFVPSEDADVVTALYDAGAISLCNTATSYLGNSLYCETDLGPPTRNPWAPDCTAGGSSGGAAAAVAAGLVAAAQGNDGGGALRIPAAICGLVGFQPSRGGGSGVPLGFGAVGLPTNGPIPPTAVDAAGRRLPRGGDPGRPRTAAADRPLDHADARRRAGGPGLPGGRRRGRRGPGRRRPRGGGRGTARGPGRLRPVRDPVAGAGPGHPGAAGAGGGAAAGHPVAARARPRGQRAPAAGGPRRGAGRGAGGRPPPVRLRPAAVADPGRAAGTGR